MAFARKYDPTLQILDVQLLADFDDYFPDVAATLASVEEPRVFQTGWILKPDTVMQEKAGTTPAKTYEDLVVDLLKKEKGSWFILWNSFSTVRRPIKVAHDATSLRRRLLRRTQLKPADLDKKFKIIVAHNLDFELPQLMTTFFPPSKTAAPDTLEKELAKLWVTDFPTQNPLKTRITEFTLFAFHQKTIVVLGKKAGASTLTAYCGGMDVIATPGIYESGRDWHDLAMRVRGDRGLGVLRNFCDRWNAEVARLSEVVSLGVTSSDSLTASTLFTATGSAVASDTTMQLTIPSKDLAKRKTDILAIYETLFNAAATRVMLWNQYIRFPDLLTKLRDRLLAVTDLRAVIILPGYPEEVSDIDALSMLRHQFARETDATKRAALLKKIEAAADAIDPINKLALKLQVACFKDLVPLSRVRIWVPELKKLRGSKLVEVRAKPYIHVKALLVDEAAIAVGSPNLGGRSLTGKGDTEINLTFQRGTHATEPDVPELIRDARFHWETDPVDDKDAAYVKGNYFFDHNLVRYTTDYLDVDTKLAAFPIGEAAILKYFRAFKGKGGLDKSLAKVPSETEIKLALAAVTLRGINVATTDLGDLLMPEVVDLF